MNNFYVSPEAELVLISAEDIISTSLSIDLPFYPIEDEAEI